MGKGTLFSIHVQFYDCKKTNKASAVPLSCDRNTARHNYCTADTAPVRAKLNLPRRQFQAKLLNYQFESLENSRSSLLICL